MAPADSRGSENECLPTGITEAGTLGAARLYRVEQRRRDQGALGWGAWPSAVP